MNDDNGFYTMKGYQLIETDKLSTSMEDYLEMICRMCENVRVVRINELAENLHVKPSSASKMVNNLMDAGYLEYKKYGFIELTQKGKLTGEYLLYRHKVLFDFLCALNHTDNELEQVEKIEHFIDEKSVCNLEKLTQKMLMQEKNSEQ